jgi:hypothetical protein
MTLTCGCPECRRGPECPSTLLQLLALAPRRRRGNETERLPQGDTCAPSASVGALTSSGAVVGAGQ